MTEAAKHPKKKAWQSKEILAFCDAENGREFDALIGAEGQRKINEEIGVKMKKEKEEWIRPECSEIEENQNLSNETFQIIKDLNTQKKSRIKI